MTIKLNCQLILAIYIVKKLVENRDWDDLKWSPNYLANFLYLCIFPHIRSND